MLVFRQILRSTKWMNPYHFVNFCIEGFFTEATLFQEYLVEQKHRSSAEFFFFLKYFLGTLKIGNSKIG